ncbi:dynein axonemal assembly factor 6 [Phlebotomus argentipes]|uniref:dynein axonemal assembly factor 6 n=1 Tax=Phlebotomus argentipes TaxID=94469 RepID=UPI0028933692|nr:dynein axonemal assembly factor 6 [Phlebotomus argentipes]
MDEIGSGDQLILLNKLLNPPERDSDSDGEDFTPTKKSSVTPASFFTESSQQKVCQTVQKIKENFPRTLEEWEALEEVHNEELDTRKRPQYQIAYKQEVKVEDVFLQMSNKTTATSSCEDMVITIDLSEETGEVDQIDLKVTETEIDLQTPIYHLKIPLPHPVDPDRKKAAWNPEKKKLTLTLRMRRELDFVNF